MLPTLVDTSWVLVFQERAEELEDEEYVDTEYADDTAVHDGSKDGLQEIADLLSHMQA